MPLGDRISGQRERQALQKSLIKIIAPLVLERRLLKITINRISLPEALCRAQILRCFSPGRMGFHKVSNLPLSPLVQKLKDTERYWKTLSCSGLRIDTNSRPLSPVLPLACLSTGLVELLCRKKRQHGDCSTLHSTMSLSTEIANDRECN